MNEAFFSSIIWLRLVGHIYCIIASEKTPQRERERERATETARVRKEYKQCALCITQWKKIWTRSWLDSNISYDLCFLNDEMMNEWTTTLVRYRNQATVHSVETKRSLHRFVRKMILISPSIVWKQVKLCHDKMIITEEENRMVSAGLCGTHTDPIDEPMWDNALLIQVQFNQKSRN